MTKEKLQSLLDSGAITQEEFDEMIKNIADPEPAPEGSGEPEPTNEPIDLDKLDKIIQSKVDKITAKLGKENADLKKQLDKEKRARMSDEEIRQLETKEREEALAEREKALLDKENRLYAVKAIKEAGLDDGSDISLSLVDFVMGEDETEINDKVKAFKELFDKAVAAEVKKRFKDNGRTPQKGTDANSGVNPFKKETLNLTKQLELLRNNPELAARYQAEAGIV